jgi:hypothetical protein
MLNWISGQPLHRSYPNPTLLIWTIWLNRVGSLVIGRVCYHAQMHRPLALLGRLLVILAGAFWLGGLTFYGAVVIHTASDVLGSHRLVGFITQRVTVWLNVSAVVALAIFLVNLLICWRFAGRVAKSAIASSWLLMLFMQIVQFALHPMLDRLLDPQGHRILNSSFFSLHRMYLFSSMLQQAGGLLYLVVTLYVWQQIDRVRLPIAHPLKSTVSLITT